MSLTIDDLLAVLASLRSEAEMTISASGEFAAYSGEPPSRDNLAARFLQPFADEYASARKLHDDAMARLREVRKRLRIQERTVIERLGRLFGSTRRVTARRRKYLGTAPSSAVRCAHLLEHARDRELTAMMDLVDGDGSRLVELELLAAEERHSGEVRKRTDARATIAKQQKIVSRIAEYTGWLSGEARRFEKDIPLVHMSEQAIEQHFGRFRDAAKPVIRVEGSPRADRIFSEIASAITAEAAEGPYGLHRHASSLPNVLAHCWTEIDPGAAVEISNAGDHYRALVQRLSRPRSVHPNVAALLYWIAASAELRLTDKATPKWDEEKATPRLMDGLVESAETLGGPLLDALGYGRDHPFSVATFETGRDLEADTGSDFGIILSLALEDGEMTIAALVQAKLSKRGIANVHRKSEVRGNNHQIVALTSTPALGFYAFIDEDPRNGLPILVTSADRVRADLLGAASIADPVELIPTQCRYNAGNTATDLPTFLGFSLLKTGVRFSSASTALRKLAETAPEKIAKRLLIVEIGRPMRDELKIELERFGYKPRKRMRTPTEMLAEAQRSSRGREM